MTEQTYRIKPLEWKDDVTSIDAEYVAKHPLGRFEVRRDHRDEWTYIAQFGGEWYHVRPCESLEDGKAKCFAYLCEKLLPALDPA